MDESENNELQDALDKIKAKIDDLRQVPAECWICGEITNNWGVIIPEGSPGALGFGSTTDGRTRVVFYPVCSCHDVEDENNKNIITFRLVLKKMEMCN
jgi:hypothetical protein